MFHIYWPAVTALTMFVTFIIFIILRHGPKLCKTRHTTLPTYYNRQHHAEAYEQQVSYA